MLPDSVQAIRFVAERLAELNERMAFLGGATLGLLIAEPGAPPPRPTRDVDLVVEITMLEYLNNSFRTQLLAHGFRESPEEGVICRWTVGGTKVDIMPTTSTILGFGNRCLDVQSQTSLVHASYALCFRVLCEDVVLCCLF